MVLKQSLDYCTNLSTRKMVAPVDGHLPALKDRIFSFSDEAAAAEHLSFVVSFYLHSHRTLTMEPRICFVH